VSASLGRPSTPVAERPIDVLFLGHASARREQFFAAHAAVFSSRVCRLLFVDVGRPRHSDTPGYVSAQARSALLSRSKIVLNVHSSERTYFERHRALLALSHGCAFVTETSGVTEPLMPGTHFVMAPIRELAAACDLLLNDPERLAAIAHAGHELARTDLQMAESCRTMLAHAARTRDFRTLGVEHDRVRNEVRGRLKAGLARRAAGEPDWTVEANAGADERAGAAVSVVITVFDYARYLRECIGSVTAAEAPEGGFELVVVDDASTDDSVTVARELIHGTQIPARLVRKHHNTGLADARNVGVELARGTFVLTLDADNAIYPSCLRVLADANRQQGVAAAYPILRRFHDPSGQPAGLLGVYPWSVRDLVRGPYIDALAMFRRESLRAVGGYSTELIDYGWFGWEDYDLWLKLADAGHTCVQVPQVLASYRVHAESMIRHTNRGTEAIAGHLRRKFDRLKRAHPGLDRYFGFPDASARVAAASPAPSSDIDAWQRCRALEAQLGAMYGSWSWRVTGPLRAAYDLFPRRLRGKG
jgi:glycosyltransferase involved in cell wall biosynthesis